MGYNSGKGFDICVHYHSTPLARSSLKLGSCILLLNQMAEGVVLGIPGSDYAIFYGVMACGVQGVDQSLSTRVSNDVPDAHVVLVAVMMVFTSLFMKLFDFRYRGDNVIGSMCCSDMNLAGASDEKVGPLLVNMHLGVHIC